MRDCFLVTVCALTFVATGHHASFASGATCESLASLTLPEATITSATAVPAGPFTPPGAQGRAGAGAPSPTLPAFCRVAATLKPTSESNIRIEVWLPPAESWNGKFLGTGNGGAGGVIAYGGLVNGLQRGFAAANTDMGTTTTGLNFSFGVGHPEMVKDWAYRSTHLMTVVAKQIVKAFYDRDARLSYFTGCSTGGHQALTEAQRFPGDYNGIVSGDPANNRTHLHVVGIWNYNATHADPDSYFPLSKTRAINRAVLAACDKLDGLEDGVIDDPRRCHFDPATIVCRDGDGPECLTEKQAAALRKIYAGPSNPRTGEPIFPGMSPGSEVNPLGLERTLASAPTATGGPQQVVGGLVNWATSFKGPHFDFDRDMAAIDAELGPIINDVNPDLSPLKKRGGKLIMYTGWADPLIPSQDLVNYYERVQRAMGGADQTQEFARLFMVPGMGHCGSGTAPNQFDTLSALDQWVEKGVAPDTMIASHRTGGTVDRTRPLCPYPQVAKWKGSGSTDDAANFACVMPAPAPALAPASAASAGPDQGSLIPGYPDVIGEYLQIPGADAPGTPVGFNTAAFLRVRTASDGDQPRPANAVIVAMPGFASVPGHWLYLAAQLVHKASQRRCDAAGTNDVHCRIEVWIVHRRGANLEDTAGLRQARVKKDPALAVNYYFGPSILSADPKRPGKFPLAAPHTLVGRPDATWQPLTQADLAFVADWGFEVYAGDVDKMIALVKPQSGSKNVFLAGHSQGGGFVSNYAGRRLADGRRGYENLAGLIFLDGGPSAGATPAPPAERLAGYFSNVSRLRSGTSSVYTMTDGLLGALGGPASYALNSVVGVYYALKDPDSESTMFGLRVVGALPASPAGDAFLSGLRVTYRARAGLSFDVDPVPGAPGMQNAVLSRLGEGLGQLDFTPVAGTEGSCDPLKPAPPCPPSVAQIDRNKVYRWREGGGDGTVPNRVGKAQWWLSSLAYAPTRANIRPVTASFSSSGKKTIDASDLTAYNWYASIRYDSDMQFLGEFRTLSLHDQGVNLDIDKPAIAGVPVYVAHQTTNTTLNNPFPLVTDFTEINRNGVFQTAAAKTTTPLDPAINVSLYFHTDFVSADDTLAGQVTPGKPGASAVSNTLIDWVLARSKGRADVPTPQQLGVGKMY